MIRIVIDCNKNTGAVDLVGERGRQFDPAEGASLLKERSPNKQLAPHPALPSDSRLWAALQGISGGAWAGCVYDVDKIVSGLSKG